MTMPNTPDELVASTGTRAGDPHDSDRAGRRTSAVAPVYRRVGFVLGSLELSDGVLKLLDHAWIAGAGYVGIGIFLLLAPSAWWASIGVARPRPLTEAQRRRSAWILSHCVEVSIVVGTTFTLSIGCLAAYRLGHWPLSVAVCAPGGIVLGWMMARGIRRLAP